MIRTDYVKMKSLDGVAYRQKLKSGGSGIVILKRGYGQPGIASIDKRESRPILQANVNASEFPGEAFAEAIELTVGMPYSKRQAIAYPLDEVIEEVMETAVEEDESREDLDIVNSMEYKAIVEQFTDKKGVLSYTLLNKDFIQSAKKSKTTATMIANKEPVEKIVLAIARQRLTNITGNRNLDEKMVEGIIGLLDEVSPRYVFKDLQDEIRKMLAR